MEIAAILVREVLVIFLLIAAGALSRKLGVLNEENARAVSNLLLTIVMPVMIVNAFQVAPVPELLLSLLFCLVFCVVFHLGCVLVAGRVFKDPGDGTNQFRVSRLASVLSNCGFMGFPLLMATVGQVGVLYGAVFLGVFNVFSWAWCAPLLSGQRFRPAHLLRNPALAGFVVGAALYVSNIRLPDVLGAAAGYIAGINTPLSMMVTGVFLSTVNLRSAVGEAAVYKTVLLRNIVFPCATLLALWAVGVTRWLPGGKPFALSIMVMVSCSTAASSILLPARYGCDSSHGAKLVLASTLAAVLTLPAVVAVSDFLL